MLRFATLGFCLGAYRYGALKAAKARAGATAGARRQQRSRSAAAATWMVRDLVNTPANLLGPVELAEFAASLGRRYGAAVEIITGDALAEAYPTVAAVGRGSARPPHVAILRWSGSTAHADAPLISLCGKGVCFDTGGYDIKPSSGMLRMKKDMGGAATVLGLARMIMEADLPVRLVVRVGCVENSISGTAMRPLDVIRTRKGVTVEVGNTDAEGRLVLCDLLAEACDEHAGAAGRLRHADRRRARGARSGPAGDVLQRRRLGGTAVAQRPRAARPALAAAALGALRPLAGQPDRRFQQRFVKAACWRDHRGIIPAAVCCSRASRGRISICMPGTTRPRRAIPEGGEAYGMRAMFCSAGGASGECGAGLNNSW